jgi:hypothetical protein
VATEDSLELVRQNITDPRQWTDPEIILEVLENAPSARGLIYGYLAEAQLSRWLVANGVPLERQLRDDDHAKTKSDRTILHEGRRYTIQVKSMQTNSINGDGSGFTADIQCKGSDRRRVILPNGHQIETANYVAGEFMVLATPLHPFTQQWDFAFRLNSTLERTTWPKYAPEDRPYLLKTTVPISWPLEAPWTTDLFGLLADTPDLGEVITTGSDQEPGLVRAPNSNATIEISDLSDLTLF